MCTSVDCYHYRCCHKSYKPKNMGTSFKNNFPNFSSLFLKYSDCTLLNTNFQEAHATSFLCYCIFNANTHITGIISYCTC